MTYKIGQTIFLNGIPWEIIGHKRGVYRLTHKCQRWVLHASPDGVIMETRTYRINSHRRLDCPER